MSDIEYLKQAIELAKKSTEPLKCACIIVKDGTILSQAYNSQRVDNVAIYHAEIKAVRDANLKLNSRKLKGSVAYCSCEPCVMCLTALSLASVERIVFCQTIKELASNDPMGYINLFEFAERNLKFVPKLEKLEIT